MQNSLVLLISQQLMLHTQLHQPPRQATRGPWNTQARALKQYLTERVIPLNAVQPLAANRQQWQEHMPQPQDYLPPPKYGPHRFSFTDSILRTLRSPPPWCFKTFTSRKLSGERSHTTLTWLDPEHGWSTLSHTRYGSPRKAAIASLHHLLTHMTMGYRPVLILIYVLDVGFYECLRGLLLY